MDRMHLHSLNFSSLLSKPSQLKMLAINGIETARCTSYDTILSSALRVVLIDVFSVGS